MKKFYITTPIYYPSSNLHIGHTYTTVIADSMARFKRLEGYDVFLLTGTDEHGEKIEKIAKEAGVSPKEYVDNIVSWVKELWETMEISYDDFIRTTDERHSKRVQEIFMKLYENGDIYKGEYKGLYCTSCEAFWTEKQAGADMTCPDCGKKLKEVSEEAYFFKLKKYETQVLDLLENTDFLKPDSRRNEMVAFVKQGLEDLCISRSSFDWGIPVPIEEGQVIYVWLDALTNYVTALGYPDDSAPLFDRYWPADVHLVGKEIVRFHTIIWPAILMSLNIPLPKHVLGHGWLLLGGGKMSKSEGNVIDPKELISKYGVDAVKYFLLREYSFGQDGAYSLSALLQRMNGDLANDLGNLLSRSIAMAEKYFDGVVIKEDGDVTEGETELKNTAEHLPAEVSKLINDFDFSHALEKIWDFIRMANKYIDITEPWKLAKDEGSEKILMRVLYNLLESLRITSILISATLPHSANEMRKQLGIERAEIKLDDAKVFGLENKYEVKKGKVLFPRIDIEKELS